MKKFRSSLLLVLVALVLLSTRGGPSMPFLHAAGAAAGAQETDTDNDTMPDAWEIFFGLDENDPGDATGDPDGDGRTNAQEFADGRHPNGVHMRYFAEGSTGYFDTSVGVLNLSETETAHVAIALLNEVGGVVSHRFTLAPRARRTVSINEVLGISAAVAIVVESDVPVAADRWMTWGTTGIGASLDSGAPAPATTWYFAEGATGPFLLYYLFENPGMTPATVTIQYLLEARPPVTTTHTLPPQSRTTIPVNQDHPDLAIASVGSVITSTAPIFAERAMYVNAGGALGGGSASAGSNQLSTQWYFGEGSTGPFFQCFLSLLNPGATDATATVTYHMSDGSTASKAYPVPAGGRRTVYFNGEAETDPALASLATGPVWFTVNSTQPILGERAMWWRDWPWYEGHSAPGNTMSAVSWAVPEGRDGGDTREQTYVLIGNTTTTPGQVRLTLIPDTGAPSTREVPIAAGERLTVNIGNLFGLTEGRFSIVVDSLGTPAVPLAVDYARYRSVNGVPFSGGGAAPAVPIAGLGDTAPSVTTTTPAANATGVAVDANLTVTFSEPVNAGAGAFVLECPAATPVTLTNLTTSPATTFTLEPATDLPVSTACTLRIVASQITDADTIDPPDAMAADVVVPFTTSACAAIVVSPTTVPGGTANVAYAPVTFTQTGGTAPVSWSLSAGTLPSGMSLSPAGVLAGTPAASGSFTFTATVTDANSCTGSAPMTLSILAGPNQAPSFTPGPNQTSLEDAGPQAVAWATGISPGPSPDETGQVVTFNVTGNTNAALFSLGPAISPAGMLTYTAAPNATGTATITVQLQDNGGTAGGGTDTSAPQTFTITITGVNDAPVFTAGANQTVAEEAGPQSVANWATGISAGPADEAGQTLTFNVTNNTNPAFFSAGPTVDATGTLTYTPAVNAVGTATITLTLQDNGGTANGGVDTSAPQTFTITITGVNDAPSFTAGANQTAFEDSGLQTVAGWATAISAGPLDEAGQALTFNVTGNTNPALFSTAPAVSPAGTLTYAPAANATGTATITLTLSDNGGVAGGGVDTSAPQSFTITVNGVNDAPSFTVGANQTVVEDSGAQTVAVWGTAISPGPANEAGQTLTFNVTGNTNAALFSTGPSVSSTGTLSYTPALGAVGAATITLTLQDNGGTANGGVDTSAPQTFTITITGINDAPSFTAGANQTVLEDSGAQTAAGWATAISPGPADEAGQTVMFNVTGNTNTALFSVAPAVSPAGNLTYTPAANASGVAAITLTLQDDGGTANGGVNTSAPQSFTITVTGINDAPSFTAGANPTSAEDAGPVTVNPWATAISGGPPNEAGQTVSFLVTGNTNPALFSAAPAVSSAGVLTYTSALNAFGTATITLVAQDNGGAANGGVDTSAPQMFTITVTPVNDAPMLTNATIAYSTVGNTQLHVQGATLPGLASVGDASGALLKAVVSDIDGPAVPVVVAQTNVDTGEGTLTIAADGSFTYVPDAGFTGIDTFSVQVTDTVTPVTLTVNITVGELVWYVNNQTGPNNPPGSDGRSTDAWETLAEAQAGTGPNSTIFIFNGLTATTPLSGSIALKNGQKLIGEGVGLTVAGFPTLVAAGTRPRIVATGDAVTVIANTANGNRTGVEIRGLNLASTTGNAIEASSANAQDLGVRISENIVAGSGQDGIIIQAASAGTATLAVHDNAITAGGNGLQIARSSTGTVFITAFHNNVVSGDTVASGIVVTGPSVVFDAVPGGLLDQVAGGATIIGAPGNGVGVAGMLLTSVAGDLSFTDLDIVSGNGAALFVSGTGAFTPATGTRITANPGAASLAATSGPAASLSDLTSELQLSGLSSANSTGNGVLLTNVAGTFTAPTTATITNATSADFNVSGGAATVTYNGTITDDQGVLVSIANTTGGAKSFTGAITDANDGDGNGISLTSNGGATITFSGGLLLSTGANPAFTATGGGTVNVCDENPCNPAATGALVNTITTTSGTALNVAGTNIGSNNLEFRSISAGTGSGSVGNGIILDNTGTAAANGGLTIKGTGGAGSGGTIQHKTGSNGSTTQGIGIYLNQTRNASFSRMQLNDFENFAILATDANGFSLQNSVVSGLSGNDAGSDEGAMLFVNSSGTLDITNSQISGGFEDNLRVLYDSATPDTATYNITGNTFSDLQSGNNALVNLRSATTASSSSNVTFNVGSSSNPALGNTFDNSANQNPLPPPATQWFGDGILVTFEGGFQHTINIDNNTFFELFQAIDFAGNFSADVDARIYNNTITYTEGVGAIAFGTGSSSTAGMLFQMLIEDNDIGGLGNDSGSRLGTGIVGDFRGAETARVTIHQNVVRDTEVNPINIISQMTLGQDGDTHLRITNNTIASIDDDAGAGAGVIPGINVTTNAATNGDILLTISGNTASSINEDGILVRQATLNNTYSLEDFAGDGTNSAAVDSYLEGQNPGTTARVRTGGSVVNYTSQNLNNTNAPAPLTP